MADSHPIENWRPVVGYEGRYEVSDLGRVRGIDRFDHRGQRIRGRVRKNVVHKYGYLVVGLCGGTAEAQKQVKVHRLVLEAFVGPCPPGMECCHNNGDRSDARLANLRWDTRLSNSADAIRHGTTVRGERHVAAKLTDAAVLEIFALRAAGLSYKKIADRFGVSGNRIGLILSRKRWKHVRLPEEMT